jgi:hypothetical protein
MNMSMQDGGFVTIDLHMLITDFKLRLRFCLGMRCKPRFLKINFFICFGSFWSADLKNNFEKNKKNHFDTFQHEK